MSEQSKGNKRNNIMIYNVNKNSTIIGVRVSRKNRSLKEWGEEITKVYEGMK